MFYLAGLYDLEIEIERKCEVIVQVRMFYTVLYCTVNCDFLEYGKVIWI